MDQRRTLRERGLGQDAIPVLVEAGLTSISNSPGLLTAAEATAIWSRSPGVPGWLGLRGWAGLGQ